MTTKLYYKMTKQNEEDTREIMKHNKLQGNVSDFIIDILKNLVMQNISQLPNLLSQKTIKQEDLDKQIVQFSGRPIKGEGEDRVVIFTGPKMSNGLIQSCKISNALSKDDKPIQSVDEYVNQFLKVQFEGFRNFVIKKELDEEVTEDKKETVKVEMESVKENFKKKVTGN